MKSPACLCLFLLLGLVSSAGATPLSGIKSVGPTGDYASLTAAIADVKTQTLGGALVLELQSAYVGTVETFPLVFSNLGTTATNTLTVRPAADATALSISSADTTAATVDLNGAQFVTIDGRPGGLGTNAGSGGGTASQLTIANTSTSGVALRFINEASSNTLRYTTLRGVNTSASSGTVVFSTTSGANGNDNNTVDHCDVADGASTPRNGIYSLGTTTTSAQNNSGDVVSNSNVFNFAAATGVDAAGVRLDGGNTDWTISGNSFYQTTSRAAVAATTRPIYVNASAGNGFAVNDNSIGGSSARTSGAAWTAIGTGSAGVFIGIHLNVGTVATSSAQGNTIANILWTSSSNANTLPGVWSGIYVSAGNVNIGTVSGNTVGSGTGTGSISVTTSGDGGTSFGIGSISNDTVVIAGNAVGSIAVSGTGTIVKRSASLVGIQVAGGTGNVSNNVIGSTSTANSFNAAASMSTSANQQVVGIYSSGVISMLITGNTVANLKNNSAQTLVSGPVIGILAAGGVNTVSGNTVRNLFSSAGSGGSPAGASVLGIWLSSTSAGQTLSQNTLHSLENTAGLAQVTGIYYSGPTTGTNVIARNSVHSVAVTSSDTASSVTGMYFAAGAFTAQNNMVSLGFDASGVSTAGGTSLSGILDLGTTTARNFFHNSVYLGGSQTFSGNSTKAFQGGGGTRSFRNNVFVNARSNSGGTGKHYAVFYNTASPNGLTANGNLYFASGTGGVLGFYSGNLTTLTAWQAATGRDSSSLNVDPLYVNPAGDADTVNLHVAATSPVINAGLPVGVTDDFDGEARGTSTPFIGADEFPAPSIAVAQTADVTDGGSVTFGNVTLGSSSAAKTFTITNVGTANLSSLAITGSTSEFTVSALSDTSIPVGNGSVTFTVTFTPSASGARNASLQIASNVLGTKNPFDINLTGTGQTVFEAWATTNGVSSNPTAAGANGLPNLQNFAFGVNPTTGGSGALVFNGTLGAGGTIGTTGQPITRIEGTDTRALFIRRKDFASVGLTYTVEFSNDLSGWQDSVDAPVVLADDGTNQVVAVPFPPSFSTNGFFKVRTSLP